MKLVVLFFTLTSALATFAADGARTNRSPENRVPSYGGALDSLFGDGLSPGKPEQRSTKRKSVHAIFRSEDKGVTWTRSDSGLPGSARVNALETHGQAVFAGTDAGVFRSSDAGRTWRATRTLADGKHRVLCFTSLGQTLLAGTERIGIAGSTDGGETWKSMNQGLGNRKVLSLLEAQGVVYAGTDQNGVYRSADGGHTWASSSQGIPARAQIFAMTAVGKKVFAGLYGKGLYRFDEVEQTWSRVGPVTPLALATLEDTLAVGHNPGGIFRSGDLGETWSNGSAGLESHAPVWAMASGGGRMFAGVSGGIYYSVDLGQTWLRAHHGLPAVSPGVAFLATETFVLAAAIVEE